MSTFTENPEKQANLEETSNKTNISSNLTTTRVTSEEDKKRDPLLGLGIKDRARRGETTSLKQILDLALKRKNITSIVRLEDRLLKVTLESQEEPHQQLIVQVIQREIENLKPEAFDKVRLEARKKGIDRIQWFEIINCKSARKVNSSSTQENFVDRFLPYLINTKLFLISGCIIGILTLGSLGYFGLTRTKVPNVVGQEIKYARGILKGKSFDAEVTEQVEENIQPGQVLQQNPKANAWFRKGKAVKLTVAKVPTYTLKGSLTLLDSDIGGDKNYCYGTGGYGDIEAGMAVTVKDGNGNILATSKTGTGQSDDDLSFIVSCRFPFEVQVPKTDFYSIEVGRRGEVNFSLQELKEKNWEVTLSIGS